MKLKIKLTIRQLALVGFVFLFCVGLLVMNQNCSQVNFTAAPITASSLGVIPPVCQVISAQAVQPQLNYAWDWGSDVMPDFKQVMSAPVVGDIDGKGIPSIVFSSYQNSSYTSKGVLRVLNGATGKTKFSISDDALMPFASTSPLLVDIDGDGTGEIIYLHYGEQKVIALNHDGGLRWEFPLSSSLSNCLAGFSAAKLDGANAKTNIIVGNWVIAEDSSKKPYLRSTLDDVTSNCDTYATNLSPTGDFNIIGNNMVMDKNGKKIWSFLRSGYPSNANLHLEKVDPKYLNQSEVVVTGGGYLTIYNSQTGEVISDKLLPHDLSCGAASVGGGQATIGNFSGDPQSVEIAVATGKNLTIFDYQGNVIAKSVTQDCSSEVTGVTSFDFNGDGKPEIIYGDEKYVRIYSMDENHNLNVVWQEVNPTGTLREYPVVADVSGDGYAKLVVVANNMWVDTSAAYTYSDATENAHALNTTGLRVFGPNVKNSWMPTRKVWNQHSYIVTNVNENLTSTSNTWNDTLSSMFKVNTQGFASATCTQAH